MQKAVIALLVLSGIAAAAPLLLHRRRITC